jgi:hypothetical protein
VRLTLEQQDEAPLTVVLSVICGFFGGITATHVAARHPDVIARSTVQTFPVLRASRFELLNPAGHPVAHWGFDSNSNTNEIAFVDGNGRSTLRLGVEADQRQRPFVKFAGRDGADRFIVLLDGSDKPILVMNDGGWEGRVMLGHMNSSDTASPEFDNWSLRFSDPAVHDSAGIGVSTPPQGLRRTGFMFLHDAHGSSWTQAPLTH